MGAVVPWLVSRFRCFLRDCSILSSTLTSGAEIGEWAQGPPSFWQFLLGQMKMWALLEIDWGPWALLKTKFAAFSMLTTGLGAHLIPSPQHMFSIFFLCEPQMNSFILTHSTRVSGQARSWWHGGGTTPGNGKTIAPLALSIYQLMYAYIYIHCNCIILCMIFSCKGLEPTALQTTWLS